MENIAPVSEIEKEKPNIAEGGTDLSFEKKEYKPNVVLYVFKNVVIAIDTTGKNYKELPEIFLGTFDGEFSIESMGQPEIKRESVNMERISACVAKVVEESGIHEFWLYPYGDDKPDDRKSREDARIRLFKRYINITQAPGGFGYIMKV